MRTGVRVTIGVAAFVSATGYTQQTRVEPQTDLLGALTNGDVDFVRHDPRRHPDIAARTSSSTTLLMEAAGSEAEENVELVNPNLEAGGAKSINVTDDDGCTALLYACRGARAVHQ
jgi:hypothetical protein